MEYSADQMARLRSFLGLSQEEFAKSIDYSRSYVKDIESGRVKPSRGFLEAVRSKYGLSIDALFSNLGRQIIDGLNVISITPSNKGFIYLYDFTDNGINEAEKKLLDFLSGKKFKIIDGRQIKGRRAFYAALSGLEERTTWIDRHFDHFLRTWNDTGNDYFIVLKRFSESPIRDKMPY